jgi:soluble lytic murein transglycosylase
MPASGRLLGVRERDLWDERTNIITGTRLLADALAYWRGQAVDDPVPFALAEYNAGRPTVLKWAGSRQAAAFVAGLPNAGVRRYIERVLAYHAEYRAP